MRPSTLVMFLALVAGTARAEGVETANAADVRCVIGMAVMGRNDQYRQTASIGSFYFSGRIEGRSPDFDLKRAIRLETGRIGLQEYPDIIRRCTDQIGAKGRMLMEVIERPPSRGVGR